MRENARKPTKEMIWLIPIIVTLIFLYGLLTIGVGMANPLSGEESSLADVLKNLNFYYIRLQAAWFGLGLLLMGVVVVIDYALYGEMHHVIYWGSIALLAAVLVMGKTVRGAQAWFQIDQWGRSLQPSELTKIAIIIFLAKKLSYFENGITRLKDFLPLLIYTLIPVALIVLQNDYGTAIVYLAIFIGMVFLSGVSLKVLAPIGAAGLAAMPLMWFFVMKDAQKERILTFLYPTADVNGSGYHVAQSKIAIGSGQLSGKGLLSAGAMSQLNFIPDKHTDFIFAVAGETFGFVGAIVLVSLYALLIFRLLLLAYNTRDKFGSLIVVGVLSMLMFHIFENIGMTIGIMPVTGIPLPFMSYGGSSMFTNMIAVGLALNVGWRRHKNKYRKENVALKLVPKNIRKLFDAKGKRARV